MWSSGTLLLKVLLPISWVEFHLVGQSWCVGSLLVKLDRLVSRRYAWCMVLLWWIQINTCSSCALMFLIHTITFRTTNWTEWSAQRTWLHGRMCLYPNTTLISWNMCFTTVVALEPLSLTTFNSLGSTFNPIPFKCSKKVLVTRTPMPRPLATSMMVSSKLFDLAVTMSIQWPVTT